MNEKISKLRDIIENQDVKFKKDLAINVAMLILIFLLMAINIYSTIKPQQIGNPVADQILIYVALVFFFLWTLFCIVRNVIAIVGMHKLNGYIKINSLDSSDVESIPTWMFFSGYLYDVIDNNISEQVKPLTFHLNKKKSNLLSLNFRQAFASLLVLLTGIAFFVSEVIYFKYVDFSHWEIIFGLIIMLILIVVVFGWMIPRQIIINIKIEKNNKQQISEYDYFHSQRFLLTQKVLTKFWNEK